MSKNEPSSFIQSEVEFLLAEDILTLTAILSIYCHLRVWENHGRPSQKAWIQIPGLPITAGVTAT